MKISVIMLTYNREQLVRRAIGSILAQTFREFEFIIVNNGSTDQSGAIVDEYAEKDNRIRIIHRGRGNIGAGRNTGLDAARGDYIAFIDDDDWCEPDFLEFLYNLAIENQADISMCGSLEKEYDEKHIYNPEDALIELFWRKRFNVQFPTKLINRRIFDNVRFSETSKYDDIELMPSIIAYAGRIAYHGLAKYTFYRHDSNNSSWTTNHKLLDAETLEEYLRVYRARTEWLCGRFPGNADYWRYFEWSFMISMVEKIIRLGLVDCYKHRDMMAKALRKFYVEFSNSPHILDFEKRWIKKYII